MNVIILSLIIYYILLLILYYHGKNYLSDKTIGFIYMGIVATFIISIIYKERIKSITGGATGKIIPDAKIYQQLYKTILEIKDITDQLSNTQKEIDNEINRIKEIKRDINPIVSFSTIPKNIEKEEDIVYTTIQPNKIIQLEKSIHDHKKTPINVNDSYIQKIIKLGKTSIQHINKNPLDIVSWQSINLYTYIHSDKQLITINKEELPYYYIAHHINQKKQVFPKIFTIYEYDNKTYIELERIYTTLEDYITHDLPKEALYTLTVQEQDKSNILSIYRRKLPTQYVDSSISQDELHKITFNKNTYTAFIENIQKKYITTFQSFNKQLHSIYKYLKQEKWSYNSFLCKDIGIRKDGIIVLMNPTCIIDDPLYQAYTNYTISQYSIDGMYTIRTLQVPIDTLKTIISDTRTILQMKVIL